MNVREQRERLQEQQTAALVKLDRMLQELERLGGKRIKPLEEVVKEFDLETLKSVVFDIDAALASYTTAERELIRLKE